MFRCGCPPRLERFVLKLLRSAMEHTGEEDNTPFTFSEDVAKAEESDLRRFRAMTQREQSRAKNARSAAEAKRAAAEDKRTRSQSIC